MIDLDFVKNSFCENSKGKIIAFIRHGKRVNSNSFFPSMDVLLTDDGVQQAKRFGLALKKLGLPVKFYSSPVLRCVQTAKVIDETAYNLHENIVITNALGEPGLPILNEILSGELYAHMDCRQIYDEWLKGKHYDVLRSPEELRKLVMLFIEKIAVEGTLVVCISHDATIAAMQHALKLGDFMVENGQWVDFLDGFVVKV